MIFFSTVRFCEVSYFINFFIRPMLERSIKSINQKTPKGQSVLKVLKLPILDMESQDLGDKLEANFKSIGFAIVVNHGISQAEIDLAFAKARQGFMMSSQIKRSLGNRTGSVRNRGYTGPGEQAQEKSQKQNEKKQTFDLRHPDGPDQQIYYPEIAGFMEISKKMYEKLFTAYRNVIEGIQIGLKLEKIGQPKYPPLDGKKYVFGSLQSVYGSQK